jgi:hypothetical protein
MHSPKIFIKVLKRFCAKDRADPYRNAENNA